MRTETFAAHLEPDILRLVGLLYVRSPAKYGNNCVVSATHRSQTVADRYRSYGNQAFYLKCYRLLPLIKIVYFQLYETEIYLILQLLKVITVMYMKYKTNALAITNTFCIMPTKLVTATVMGESRILIFTGTGNKHQL